MEHMPMAGRDFGSELPEELLLVVLNKLESTDDFKTALQRFRLVSKRFRGVADGTVVSHELAFTAAALGWQCRALARMQHLTELHADLRTSLLDTTSHRVMLSGVMSAVPRIRKLHVSLGMDATLIGHSVDVDDSLSVEAALRALSALQKLSVTSYGHVSAGMDMLEAAVQHSGTLEDLTVRIAIGSVGMQRLAAHLRGNQTIKCLDFRGTAIGSSGADVLAECLMYNTSLEDLDLAHNTVGPSGAHAVSRALVGNSSIRFCSLGHNGIGDQGACHIGTALVYNQSLRHLDAQCNGIGPTGVSMLSDGLAENMGLQCLDLSGNVIQEEGARLLAAALAANSTLTRLCLRECRIQDDGLRGLVSGGRLPFPLRSLELTRNGITTWGAASIAAILAPMSGYAGGHRRSSWMVHLDVSHNPLGDAGLLSLVPGIRDARCLRCLVLQDCDLGPAGAEAIADCLDFVPLEVLNVNRNSIGCGGACALGLAIQRQRSLREVHAMHNCVKESGALSLAVALKAVETMAVVDLRGNSFPCLATKIEYMLDSCTRDVQFRF